MPGTAKQNIDCVAQPTQQIIVSKLAIRLHVTDRRLNSTASLQFFFHLRRHPLSAAGDQYLRVFELMPTVTPVDKTALHFTTRDPLYLLNGSGQGVSVIGIAGFGQHAHHEVWWSPRSP